MASAPVGASRASGEEETPRGRTPASGGGGGGKSLRITPYRGRPATSTREVERGSRYASARAQSETSFLIEPAPPTPVNHEAFVSERTPLMTPHDHPGDLASRSGSVSVRLEEEGLRDTQNRGSWWRRVRAHVAYTVRQKEPRFWANVLKILCLFAITFLCCVVLILHAEDGGRFHETIASTERPTVIYNEACDPSYPYLHLTLKGPFVALEDVDNQTFNGSSGGYLTVTLGPVVSNDSQWRLLVNQSTLSSGDFATFDHRFHCTGSSPCSVWLDIDHNGTEHVPVLYSIHRLSAQVENQILYAALTLVFVYVLIIFELVHRSLAAMLGALAALAILSAINERPSTEEVIDWVQMETLMLLFGMMIIVAVLSETGLFDFFALKMYQLAGGRVWPLVTWLCVFSAVVSSVLDNVTTVLLMTPVTIRLCEVLNLEPRVILIAEVLFSNIGGTATAIGDPPNVIIVSELEQYGIRFTVFTLHLLLGVLLAGLAGYGFMRCYYRNMQRLTNPDPPEISELRHEIDMWRRAASVWWSSQGKKL